MYKNKKNEFKETEMDPESGRKLTPTHKWWLTTGEQHDFILLLIVLNSKN